MAGPQREALFLGVALQLHLGAVDPDVPGPLVEHQTVGGRDDVRLDGRLGSPDPPEDPGKPAQLAVAEEQVISQDIAVNNLDDGTVQFYLNVKVTSDDVKKALTEIVKRKREIEQLESDLQICGIAVGGSLPEPAATKAGSLPV